MGFKKIDLTEVENAVKNLLVALGEDVNRDGLKDTPRRVAKYWAELLEGEDYTDQQVTELLQEDFNALMPKKIQKDKIEWLTREFLIALGDDPDREGLKKTPNRVARMCEEIFEGMTLTNKEIADKFNTCFEDVETGDLVVEANIPIHSFCEHHLMLMYDMSVAIGYIPNGRVIGLSKLARIADMVGKRLQLQERIGSDIADILEMILGTEDIIVVIQGKHGCMTARGIKSREAITRTATLRGKFNEDSDLRSEFYSLIR